MSLFDDIIKIWKSDSLLSQAWEESLEMLDLSHNMFVKAVKKSKKQEDWQKLVVLK